ncbi:MAG: hypothetical protein MI799_07845 [Desulfobacterales bacterium]|nr:hypothetical protein [Desulfobacterales bacterium]
MEALAKVSRETFIKRMVAHLESAYSKELREQVGLIQNPQNFVRDGVKKATLYDISYEHDVQLYLECMVELGPNFDTDSDIPWASKILQNRNLTGEDKMNAIEEHLIFLAMNE